MPFVSLLLFYSAYMISNRHQYMRVFYFCFRTSRFALIFGKQHGFWFLIHTLFGNQTTKSNSGFTTPPTLHSCFINYYYYYYYYFYYYHHSNHSASEEKKESTRNTMQVPLYAFFIRFHYYFKNHLHVHGKYPLCVILFLEETIMTRKP